MNNLEFQDDWLKSMDEFELQESHHPNLNSAVIRFYVPEGSELEWKKNFESSEIVEWVELNYISQIKRLN